MKIEDAISSLRDGRLGNVLKVAAGTAAAVWVVLQLRRELYGPGGSRMARYDSRVDKKRAQNDNKNAQSDFVDAEDAEDTETAR